MAVLAPAEIRALARVIDELDYYQILEISRKASTSELKRAYHASSRRFHPDAHRHARIMFETRGRVKGNRRRRR